MKYSCYRYSSAIHGLFIGFLVDKCDTCLSYRKSDFGWIAFTHFLILAVLNPRTFKGGGRLDANPLTCKVFLSFFLEDKTSVSDVFSCCLFIPRAHFGTGLVMVSYYGYEI